jgi:hypothetical protein
MFYWKNATRDDQLRLKAISILLGEDERLIRFLFHPTKPRLATSSTSIKQKIKSFSKGEQTLLRIALDIWGTYGGIHFDDLYTNLSPTSFMNCINALAFIKRHLYS